MLEYRVGARFGKEAAELKSLSEWQSSLPRAQKDHLESQRLKQSEGLETRRVWSRRFPESWNACADKLPEAESAAISKAKKARSGPAGPPKEREWWPEQAPFHRRSPRSSLPSFCPESCPSPGSEHLLDAFWANQNPCVNGALVCEGPLLGLIRKPGKCQENPLCLKSSKIGS